MPTIFQIHQESMEGTLIATQTLQLEEIANLKRVPTMLKMVAMLQASYVLTENDRREAPFFPMVLRYQEVITLNNPEFQCEVNEISW